MSLRILLVLLLCFAAVSHAQNEIPLSNRASATKPIPDYLIYKHFLAWVKDLDSKSPKGTTDEHKFAAPFATGASLESRHIDAIRREAYSLGEDLSKHDTKAALLVVAFRTAAKSALLRGEAMPAAPSQLHDLQQQRDTLIKSHISILKKTLGPDASARLDVYLAREIVPHISLKPIAVRQLPKFPVNRSNQDQ